MPHVMAHSAPPVQDARQFPVHWTLQLAELAQDTVLLSPSCSLHVAFVHDALDVAASLKSQWEPEVHDTRLPSPPTPLHSEESVQLTDSGPLVLPSHVEEVVQLSEQSSSPQSISQSEPATHEHAEAVHVHPGPLHVDPAPSPPQPTPSAIKNRQIDPKRIDRASGISPALGGWIGRKVTTIRCLPRAGGMTRQRSCGV